VPEQVVARHLHNKKRFDIRSLSPYPSLKIQAADRKHYTKDGKTGNSMGEDLLSKELGRAAVMGLNASAFKRELKALNRKNMKKRDAVATAAGGPSLAQMGTLARSLEAGELQSLLEDRVREAHSDSLRNFVAADWIEEMKEAKDLPSKKKLFCMLGRDPFNAYMALVKKKKDGKPSKAQDSQTQVTFDLILSTPADGHSCKTAKAAELGRILSHIFWRNATVNNNMRDRETNERRGDAEI